MTSRITTRLDAQVIECGVTVVPECGQDLGVCGKPFTTVPAAAAQIDPRVHQVLDSIRPLIEQKTGTPVESFTFQYAKPQE